MKLLDKLLAREPWHIAEGEEAATIIMAGLTALYPDTINPCEAHK